MTGNYCPKCGKYNRLRRDLIAHKQEGCDPKEVAAYEKRAAEKAAADKKAREEREAKAAQRKAEHDEDVSDWKMETAVNSQSDYESVTFRAVGRKSGRPIWASEVSVTRSKRINFDIEWDYKNGDRPYAWTPYEINLSSTHRQLREAKILLALQQAAIQYVENHTA